MLGRGHGDGWEVVISSLSESLRELMTMVTSSLAAFGEINQLGVSRERKEK